MPRIPLLLLLLVFTANCARRARPHEFPRPIDTETKPVSEQVKRSYTFDNEGLTFDNQFAAARLNGVLRIDDTLFQLLILPENQPINSSPWYALRVRTATDRSLTLQLTYPPGVKHRYHPKLSNDRQNWTWIDSTDLAYNIDSTTVNIHLDLLADRVYFLAGQEIVSSADVADWLSTLPSPFTNVAEAGLSKLGRAIPVVTIADGKGLDKKPTIVLFSRQHPPEVTGYLALQALVERLLDHPRLDEFLSRYQLLLFPIINPDGVDLGHWRHTAGGIDANRDWAFYRQPETRTVADYVVRTVSKAGSRVVLGMDFHSTYRDVYYTLDSTVSPSLLPTFTAAWLKRIEDGLGNGFQVNDSPGPIGRPTSDSWFKTQFNAEGITYEIGDNTDRDFVRRKGAVSADAMIEVLLRQP